MNYKDLLDNFNPDLNVSELNIKEYNSEYYKQVEEILNKIREHDENTFIHSVRVGLLALDIASLLGFDNNIKSEAYIGGLMHDVGKMLLPINILSKEGPLTKNEFDIIKKHPSLGASYAYNIMPYEITRIILDHHEKLDGTGYPNGVDKDQINMQTRIVSIADIIDGYSSKRSYHGEKSHSETMEYIAHADGLEKLIIKELVDNNHFHFKRLQHTA